MDTDVAVVLCQQVINLPPDVEVWIVMGKGSNVTQLCINDVVESLGPGIARALPFFHAFTGCDTVSAFFGKGKVIAWNTWTKLGDKLTEAMGSLTSNDLCPITSDDPAFKILQNFTCKLYDRTTDLEDVNILREAMFCRKTQRVDCLPPTQDALLLHCNSSLYQAYIWARSDCPLLNMPSPADYGLKKNPSTNSWIPRWTSQQVFAPPQHCKCKKSCFSCICKKSSLSCTRLCNCSCIK